MAIYHCHASIVQRSMGYSAVAAAAYAAGQNLYDVRAGKEQPYGRKQGVILSQIIAPENAPEWAYKRHELWNRAELAEKRVDAQTARTFVLALPHEFTDEQNADLVFKYAREVLVSEGMIVDIGMHRADRRGDQRNDHAHLVVTMRELDGDQFARKKQREWNKTEKLEYWREQWAVYQNDALEEAGFDARVDHRTLEEQGIDREPTKHIGREATSMERRGEKSELGDINREITEEHEPDDIEATEHERYIADLVNELAAAEAEYAEELAKEFAISEEEALSAEEIENPSFPADQDEEEPPPSAPPAAREPELPQEPAPGESIFDSEISKMFERELREKGYIGEPFSDREEELEEEFEEPEYLYDQETEPEPDYPPLTFTQPQSGETIFDSPISKMFERQIREYGEIQEYGLGKHWYDRTVAFWQDLYSDAATFVKDTWQKYVSDRRNRDKSSDREGGLLDDTVDRAKSFWQKYRGRDDDPGRDDFEPDR